MSKKYLYDWQGINENAQIERGMQLTINKKSLSTWLSKQGITLITCNRWRANFWQWRCQHRARHRRANAWQQCEQMHSAGIHLNDMLGALCQYQTHRGWQMVWQHIHRAVQRGDCLSVACAQWPRLFDPLTIACLQAAEQSGQLRKIFATLAQYETQKSTLRDQLLRCLQYPALLFFTAIGVLYFFSTTLLPTLEPLLMQNGQALPPLTQFVLQVSHAVAQYALPGLCVFGITLYAWQYLKKHHRRTAAVSLKISQRLPIVRTLSYGHFTYHWCHTLQLALSQGITLLPALTLAKSTAKNKHQRHMLGTLHTALINGQCLSVALASSALFSEQLTHTIAAGEQTGELAARLKQYAKLQHLRCQTIVKHLSKTLQPVMMLCMAGFVGVLACAMYGPIFQMGQQL